jgi:methylenetetrahydrofolate dehydrogenase (NADP+)/methenyltetrahydrofolate cyclohydrolase
MQKKPLSNLMTAQILDGRTLAKKIKEDLANEVLSLTKNKKRPPSLAVVLVGEDPASTIYVRNKRKACIEVGIQSLDYNLKADVSENELLELIHKLNHSKNIDGILIQLPLPPNIDTYKIIESLNPEKDVDGFHPYNLGRLAQKNPFLRPCTPKGIITLLKAYEISITGKNAVVVGASNIVGRPMALEFLLAGATVTICHRLTQNLEQIIRQSEIIVLAAGKIDVIDYNWLNETQVLVDVGIHRLDTGKLRGDVDFLKAKEKVAWISPVPGGVGPMTICALLQNTIQATNLSD